MFKVLEENLWIFHTIILSWLIYIFFKRPKQDKSSIFSIYYVIIFVLFSFYIIADLVALLNSKTSTSHCINFFLIITSVFILNMCFFDIFKRAKKIEKKCLENGIDLHCIKGHKSILESILDFK